MLLAKNASAEAGIETVASEVFAAVERLRQIPPFSSRPGGGLTLDTAYRVSARVDAMRRARGETPVGRKIGFTNRTIWPEYGVDAPNWGYVTDRTLVQLDTVSEIPAARFIEPRIEPEIVFGLARAPSPGMDEAALAHCIDWVAHGFEIVQSIYPRWKFSGTDTSAANGLHGALAVGKRVAMGARLAEWQRELAAFTVELSCNGAPIDKGSGANVIGSPLSALRHLVGLLARDPVNPPLKAGEVVTTGTLTRAFPVNAGEIWETRIAGIPLDGIRLELT